MPVMHRGNRFNARVLALDGKLILIRPKLFLASDGNYRENRYFIAWHPPRHVEEYYLPPIMQGIQGAIKVPFGDAVISTPDTCLGAETCEELFTVGCSLVDWGLCASADKGSPTLRTSAWAFRGPRYSPTAPGRTTYVF